MIDEIQDNAQDIDSEIDDLFRENYESILKEKDLIEPRDRSNYHGPKVGENQKSPYHILFDELDGIRKMNHGLNLVNGDEIENKERGILSYLLIPGINRHMMPNQPEKSQAVRDSELNEIKAFSSIEVEAMERGLAMRGFSDLMKEKESEREWDFYDRNYL